MKESLTSLTANIVARLGGDEFAILAPNLRLRYSTRIVERLQRNLDEYNQRNDEFHLSLSVGMVEIDHDSPLDIEEQIAQVIELCTVISEERKGEIVLRWSDSLFELGVKVFSCRGRLSAASAVVCCRPFRR